MSDTLKTEETSAVEDSPAPTPRSDLPQSPASRPGGSPYGDADEMIEASLRRGPYHSGNVWVQCPHCGSEWHGFRNGLCAGSHLNGKGANEIREQSLDWLGGLPDSS